MLLPTDLQLYTFGTPRVGNHAFAIRLNAVVPLHFRVVVDGDAIASVPKFCWLYKHAGIKVDLDRQGNCVVDPSFLEWQLRASTASSISSHMMSSYRRALLRARALEGLRPPPDLVLTRRVIGEWIQKHMASEDGVPDGVAVPVQESDALQD